MEITILRSVTFVMVLAGYPGHRLKKSRKTMAVDEKSTRRQVR